MYCPELLLRIQWRDETGHIWKHTPEEECARVYDDPVTRAQRITRWNLAQCWYVLIADVLMLTAWSSLLACTNLSRSAASTTNLSHCLVGRHCDIFDIFGLHDDVDAYARPCHVTFVSWLFWAVPGLPGIESEEVSTAQITSTVTLPHRPEFLLPA